MQAFRTAAAVGLCGLVLTGPAMADEIGEQEYMEACASCHGESGAGRGPLAELLTVNVPSLTTLSEKNDGVFPMREVIHTIDGRQGTTGHGYPMPVWGNRFSEDSGESGRKGELIVRGRVLSLAYYLESIQE